jgi:hypothetical protein
MTVKAYSDRRGLKPHKNADLRNEALGRAQCVLNRRRSDQICVKKQELRVGWALGIAGI